MKKVRRIKIRRSIILSILGVFIILLMIYSVLIEPNAIAINEVTVADEDLFALFHGKKVVQISDLHITSVGRREKKLIKMLNHVQPDILFITGDFLTDGRDEDSCIDVLQQIKKPTHGIWSVLGNSDRFMRDGVQYEGRNRFARKLKSLGISVLEDRSERLDLYEEGDHLFIMGVEGENLSKAKLEFLFRDIPDDSPVILLSHFPDVFADRTDVLAVNLEEEENAGISGWGWQDNAHFEYDTGIVRFEKDGLHKLRVQRREYGVSIEQICLVAESSGESQTDVSVKGSIGNKEDNYTDINPHGNEMIVIKTEDIPDSQIFGSWRKIKDPTAGFDRVLKDISGSGSKSERPFLEPEDYFEVDFYAQGGVDYHLWVRMKAENDSPFHDSIYVQFNDSINLNGELVYRIGKIATRNELKRVNLILAGHTHGGQIRLPLIGALEIVPNHSIRFDSGLFENQNTRIYVNRGIGTALLPMRFRCSPEITVFQFLKIENKF